LTHDDSKNPHSPDNSVLSSVKDSVNEIEVRESKNPSYCRSKNRISEAMSMCTLGKYVTKKLERKTVWMHDFRICHEVDETFTLLGSPITYRSHLQGSQNQEVRTDKLFQNFGKELPLHTV
jgi:hypothetical protein